MPTVWRKNKFIAQEYYKVITEQQSTSNNTPASASIPFKS
jgi:hypothetical protein